MAITSINQIKHLDVTIVTVASDLSGTIYYHWYIDGAYIASTQASEYTFHLADSDSVRVDINDTNDADYDPIANAPAGYPARRSITWQPSLEATVKIYNIEQKIGAGSFVTIGMIPHRPGAWEYVLLSPRLADLTVHTWQVSALDAAGETLGTRTLGGETIVRIPDAPDFTVAFDGGTTKVTFSAAA